MKNVQSNFLKAELSLYKTTFSIKYFLISTLEMKQHFDTVK